LRSAWSILLTGDTNTTFTQRLIGAARLDGNVYEEVEADSGATPQAALVILLTSVAAGIGAANVGLFNPAAVIVGTFGGFLGWVSWAALTYLIGVHILPEPQTQADLGQLLRTLAFASSPGLLLVVGVVPGLRFLTGVVVHLWMLVAMVVAVQHALDYRSTGRAVAVCALGWLLSLAVAAVIGLLFATPVL
jgi:hypothetical protein